jgi:tRNA-specific 2-thiouridylase
MSTAPPARPRRVVVALSGGVDSSVAAALLVQQGYAVSGMMLRLWTANADEYADNRCCSEAAVTDARRVCAILNIPFRLVNVEAEFRSRVVDYFCDAYAGGQTPNPCLACNLHIKFGTLLRLALEAGADCLATGHYARVLSQDGKYLLLKGLDGSKDQSYVLYMLGQQELRRVLFPLGELTKHQVRALAACYSLPTATRSESQDACFVGSGDYRAFLVRARPQTMRAGPIMDQQGRVLGQHRGVAFYTVGQRQGIGIAAAHPLYVLAVDAARNAVIVGPNSALFQRELLAEHVRFVAGSPLESAGYITAKIRYKAPEAQATLTPLPDERARVVFAEPQLAITPGQGVVFYAGEAVLGGGIIAASPAREVLCA